METTTTTDNAGNGNRIDQFKTEVTDLNLKTGNVGREKLLAVLGVLLMIVGIGGAFLAYVSSLNMDSALDVQSQIAYGIACADPRGCRCGAVPALLDRGVPAHVVAAQPLRGPGQHRPHRRSRHGQELI